MKTKETTVFSNIDKYINALDISTITNERREKLQPLLTYIQQKKDENLPIRLNFICTHNSRRSHMAQIWAQTLACFYGIPNTTCYSGGTEVTAMFPRVVETLQNQGFRIDKIALGENSIYAVKFAKNEIPVIAFSKTYEHFFNPENQFAAIMTCSQADAGCPFIAGAEKRIAITYKDPKEFDYTPQQQEKYIERSEQIATEMKYIFANIQ